MHRTSSWDRYGFWMNSAGSFRSLRRSFVFWASNPLEMTTHVERAWIDGREIDLRNKQTELRDKYREKYRQLGLLPDQG